jgi:transcriptional regulator with XRE-family HTH domain
MKRPADHVSMPPAEFVAALERLGWTRTEFGHRTGLTSATVSKWATGRAPVAPWADAYLGAMLDLAMLRDKYLTPTKRRAPAEPEQPEDADD